MKNSERDRIIRILQVLVLIDNQEITKYTLESLIEELEDAKSKSKLPK